MFVTVHTSMRSVISLLRAQFLSNVCICSHLNAQCHFITQSTVPVQCLRLFTPQGTVSFHYSEHSSCPMFAFVHTSMRCVILLLRAQFLSNVCDCSHLNAQCHFITQSIVPVQCFRLFTPQCTVILLHRAQFLSNVCDCSHLNAVSFYYTAQFLSNVCDCLHLNAQCHFITQSIVPVQCFRLFTPQCTVSFHYSEHSSCPMFATVHTSMHSVVYILYNMHNRFYRLCRKSRKYCQIVKCQTRRPYARVTLACTCSFIE